MKRVGGFFLALFLLTGITMQKTSPQASLKTAPVTIPVATSSGQMMSITSDAAILMEMENGTVLFEKNSDEPKQIASVTKIMTLLLIYEAIDTGRLSLSDTVTVSEHAASMGGSQVFFEPYETQTVETMIKCICISSANDASVAMAEHIAGSEEAFVAMMNTRAAELSMKQTHFVNCCGLDIDGHLSSARDVAIMSMELMKKHSSIQEYTTTWMDTITHTTKRGDSSFGLANTNKLIKQYSGITGLKTGSTGAAKYCLSATAERNGVKLVSVVLAAPDTKTRFREAAALLDYGFARSVLYQDSASDLPAELPVRLGQQKRTTILPQHPFTYCFTNGEDITKIVKEIKLPKTLSAPLREGDKIGDYVYSFDGKELGRVPIVCTKAVKKATLLSELLECTRRFLQD